MGLFSRIFKSKPKKVVETGLGSFTLVHTGRNNTWSNSSDTISKSVRGTVDEPDIEQLEFLENIATEILTLNKKITQKFITAFKEAGFDADFTQWEDRLKITGIDIMLVHQKKSFWNITFEDLKEPYTHFTLFIEGGELTDFSIDT